MIFFRKRISKIFEDLPITWGLRGDPHMWTFLQTTFKGQRAKFRKEEFKVILQNTFDAKVLTGSVIDEKRVRIGSFPRGGISGGVIYLPWWREKGIPLLIERYGQLL